MYTLVLNQHWMILFLIGFMGSGKSFYAKGLANFLGVPMVDLDNYIEEHEGISVAKIFEKYGEQSFRDKESNAIRQAYADLLKGITENIHRNAIAGIISCGGGTPCFNENMNWMNLHGYTVWVNPPEEVICERLKKESATRPLLANIPEASLSDFVHQRMLERKPYYAMARFSVSDSNISIVDLFKAIQDAKNVL